MDKATPTPSPASVDSVMAKAMMLVGALDDSCEEATSLPFLEAVTALRAEVERLAAQAAPTEQAIKAERRAIEYSDIIQRHVLAMRAAVVASHLESPDNERLERCAACGHVFDIEDSADEEDEEPQS